MGHYIGDFYRVFKGYTKSLDNSSSTVESDVEPLKKRGTANGGKVLLSPYIVVRCSWLGTAHN